MLQPLSTWLHQWWQRGSDPVCALQRGLVLACGLIWLVGARFEWSQGEPFREVALNPVVRPLALPAPRGQIVARDGTVLADEYPSQAVAVHYRYLEEPTHPQWLRQKARQRLAKGDRRDPIKLGAEEARLRAAILAMRGRVASLCGLSAAQWAQRSLAIQQRVTSMAARINQRRQAQFWRQVQQWQAEPEDWTTIIGDFLTIDDPRPPERVIVAEELREHVVVNDAPPDVVAEIEQHPDDYPGVHILPRRERMYPEHDLASSLIGYLGPSAEVSAEPRNELGELPLVGQQGLEHSWQAELCGTPGLAWQQLDRQGNVQDVAVERPAVPGTTLHLTLDVQLQRTCERLLSEALEPSSETRVAAQSGAALVMEIPSGQLLAAASAPRFDPNVLGSPDPAARARLLEDSRHPLLERSARMALPPGSLFKTVTAIAALEETTLDPATPLLCQGYYQQPESERCQLFRRQGIGHGEVNLAEALAASCNVYFYHRAMQLGPAHLCDWAHRLHLGEKTGSDLPGEVAGHIPSPEEVTNPGELRAMAIGQHTLLVTPLQMARLMAIVASGGQLVTPRIVRESTFPLVPMAEIKPTTLSAVRAGLAQAVSDEMGTAHAGLLGMPFTVAGKTGSAQGAGEQPAHGWFAGYVPEETPRYVVVVVLEQGGDGGDQPVALARRMLLRMKQLGYLEPDRLRGEESLGN